MTRTLKKTFVLTLALMMVFTYSLSSAAFAYSKGSIYRVGSAARTVRKGAEFELEVRKSPGLSDNALRWTIGNKNVVRFDDDDISDDEIELRAVGAGTTTVTCHNATTGGKLEYKITVTSSKKGSIYRIGSASRTVRKGTEFELEVRKSAGLSDSALRWTTSNRNIVRIDDDDVSDDEIELKAVGTGTATVTCHNATTGGKLSYKITVTSSKRGSIYRIGPAHRTVERGDDFELEVRKSPGLSDSALRWTIGNKNILRFDDSDISDDEIELVALRTGKTTVTCHNATTGGKLTYTITVVNDYDDDWDD